LLKYAHRVGRAEHGYSAGEANAFGTGGGSGQNYGRSRVEVFGPVVLANAKHVQSDLVGALNAFEQHTHGIRAGDNRPRTGTQQVGCETVNSYFHLILFVFGSR
jgi:hypothetical protein